MQQPIPDPPSPSSVSSASSSFAPPYTPEPILGPAIKVGAITGCTGFVIGGVIAVVRSTPTVGLFALGTGLNCFALGATYHATRSTLFRALHDSHTKGATMNFTLKEKLCVSGASGALTGFTIGLVTRGRSNAIPGAIVWGILGLGGQYAYNVADARHTQEVMEAPHRAQGNKISMLDRVFNSKWNPVKKLTDKEYERMLRGKLLAVEAELAITNKEIEKLEKSLWQRSESENAKQ